MAEYRIMRDGRLWCVYVSGSSDVLLSSPEKEHPVAWACELAQDHGGEVDVYTEDGRLEMTYSYAGGDDTPRSR